MKMLLITFSLGLLPIAILAAETPVNCDDLARHIEHRVEKATHVTPVLKVGVHIEKSSLQVSFFNQSEFYRTKGCREAGIERDFEAVKDIPDFIKLFKLYNNALKKCTESSEISCQKASEMMHALQQKIELYTQCMALFNEEVAKGTTVDQFIIEANK